MRTTTLVLAVAILGLSSSARAEREPVISIGATFGSTGLPSSDSAPRGHAMGGMRAMLAFEDAPPAVPESHLYAIELRLVPELLVGFLADDERAIGFAGAGLRAELATTRNDPSGVPHFRGSLYVAGRAKIVGKNQDPGLELAVGEYLLHGPWCRVGWEAGFGYVKRAELATELDALFTIYVGWKS